MTRTTIIAVAAALWVPGSGPLAQNGGPTVRVARSAVVTPALAAPARAAIGVPASCGSMLKNAVLWGLGLSLATASLELTYTIVREPFVRNGHDLPAADPRLIAWAGGAGFVVGLLGTEVCRRRRR